MKTLIADDVSVSRKLVGTFLERWGYETAVAPDGEAALEQDSSIRMAILDWMMPGKDGVEVCRAIKENDARPFTYIIILTALTQKEDVIEALRAGADDYVSKPFDSRELEARVRAGERIVALESSLQEKINELENALNHVKRLQGCLPICAWCKNVRDDSDYWKSVEDYIEEHSEAEFSHGICPRCLKEQFGEVSEEV